MIIVTGGAGFYWQQYCQSIE
ncbi:hypothetical protein CGSHiR3021_05879 [Haemophilus influenzae 22.4-21]|uniref:Uncharacterized protein n=1 Tax=Haemophilus influenzae 22.4-21 TaxID=375063 RepID=A4NY31_HAEIF|nr:hypothetical protein CGSHiR3021_05879 [Haemophilus influenzae 22.4-21]